MELKPTWRRGLLEWSKGQRCGNCESNPVAKKDWYGVIGGFINGEGSISFEVKKTGSIPTLPS